jgi:hypothetical protein
MDLSFETISQLKYSLGEDFAVLKSLINFRISSLIENYKENVKLDDVCFNEPDNSPYGKLVQENKLSSTERIIFLTALAPVFYPGLLDTLIIQSSNKSHILSEIGGVTGTGKNYHGLIPTIGTALFLLAGTDMELRIKMMRFFQKESNLRKYKLIDLIDNLSIDPFTSKVITPSVEMVQYISTGESYQPDFSASFPAALLTTRLNREDLVITHDTMEDIDEINSWIKHGKEVLYQYGLAKKVKLGYRTLFYGPPGTGKTLTASLLGKENGLDVYRIDLSMVVSKYIGETEKNLANIFDRAEHQNWILFFDEADALFGKRTATKDSNDRYANQEISYLLQRIEDYSGIVILATNMKSNMDDAFYRRFQSFVYFPIPEPNLRLTLWKKTFSENLPLDAGVDLRKIAEQYELSGGSITNVIRYVTLMAVSRGESTVSEALLIYGIIKELRKEGKTVK